MKYHSPKEFSLNTILTQLTASSKVFIVFIISHPCITDNMTTEQNSILDEFICNQVDLCRANNFTSCMCSQFSEDSSNNDSQICGCSEYFTGPQCELIDLNTPEKDVHENGLSFMWSTEVCLADHVAVYARHPLRSRASFGVQELEANWTKTIRVEGMKSDAVEYLLCILPAQTWVNLTMEGEEMSLDRRSPYCGVLVTAFARTGDFSLAFYGIVIAMCLVIGALMIAQMVVRCRNRTVRERFLADVLGTFDRFRGSVKSVATHGDKNGGDKEQTGSTTAGHCNEAFFSDKDTSAEGHTNEHVHVLMEH